MFKESRGCFTSPKQFEKIFATPPKKIRDKRINTRRFFPVLENAGDDLERYHSRPKIEINPDYNRIDAPKSVSK